jgi:hypothetical protein
MKLSRPAYAKASAGKTGGVPERFNGAVLKTVVGYTTGGSNPSPSASPAEVPIYRNEGGFQVKTKQPVCRKARRAISFSTSPRPLIRLLYPLFVVGEQFK